MRHDTGRENSLENVQLFKVWNYLVFLCFGPFWPFWIRIHWYQFSETVTFWYGSGSSDLYLWLTDQSPGLAPNPVLFAVTFKLFFSLFFSLLLLHHSSQIKRSHKTVEIKGFLTIFCLMMGESRSVPLSNGSGFESGTLIGTIPKFCWQVPAVPVPYYSLLATGLWNIKSLDITSTYRYVFLNKKTIIFV